MERLGRPIRRQAVCNGHVDVAPGHAHVPVVPMAKVVVAVARQELDERSRLVVSERRLNSVSHRKSSH